jgi:hypothetical protein
MREAYRINKYKWSDRTIRPTIISFTYIGKQKESFATIEKQLNKLFEYNWKEKK